jgi:hypothetical protein
MHVRQEEQHRHVEKEDLAIVAQLLLNHEWGHYQQLQMRQGVVNGMGNVVAQAFERRQWDSVPQR